MNELQLITHRSPPLFKRELLPARPATLIHKRPPAFIRSLVPKSLFPSLHPHLEKSKEETKAPAISNTTLFLNTQNKPQPSNPPDKSPRLHALQIEIPSNPYLNPENLTHRKPPPFFNPKKIHEPKSSISEFLGPNTPTLTRFQQSDEFISNDKKLEEQYPESEKPPSHLKKSDQKVQIPSFYRTSDSNKSRDDVPLRNEVSSSIGSTIMNLQPEIVGFTLREVSGNYLSNYSIKSHSSESVLSGYSSDSVKSITKPLQIPLLSPRPTDKTTRHKTPPEFSRKKINQLSHAFLSGSSLSKSMGYSPNSSISEISSKSFANSPLNKPTDSHLSDLPFLTLIEKKDNLHVHDKRIEIYEERGGVDTINFISGVSNISNEHFTKRSPALKSSFALDASILERSRIASPFISNNFIDRSFAIPMRNINYLDGIFSEQKITFPNEFDHPMPPSFENIEFTYPSIKKGTRYYNSAVTIFSETADLFSSIKNQVTLIPLAQNQQKYSKYNLRKPLSSIEIEKMAMILAKDLNRNKYG